MENIPRKIILIGTLLFFTFGYAGSSVFAQDDSQSPIHELPRADRCSIIIMDIRELASSLKEVVKEISLLEAPVHSPSENNEYYEKQVHQYEQEMDELEEKASSLRKQIDTQEQLLDSCLQHDTAPSGQSDLENNSKEERN